MLLAESYLSILFLKLNVVRKSALSSEHIVIRMFEQVLYAISIN